MQEFNTVQSFITELSREWTYLINRKVYFYRQGHSQVFNMKLHKKLTNNKRILKLTEVIFSKE